MSKTGTWSVFAAIFLVILNVLSYLYRGFEVLAPVGTVVCCSVVRPGPSFCLPGFLQRI